MSEMKLAPEEYITERLEQYQGWYDKKSVTMKTKYLRMKALSVVGGSLVPVLVNVPFQKFWGIPVVQIVVTVISLGVVVSLSLETVFHYREQWKNYRSTEQLLGHENFFSGRGWDAITDWRMKMRSGSSWNAWKMQWPRRMRQR